MCCALGILLSFPGSIWVFLAGACLTDGDPQEVCGANYEQYWRAMDFAAVGLLGAAALGFVALVLTASVRTYREGSQPAAVASFDAF